MIKPNELRIGNYVYEKYWCNDKRNYILEQLKIESIFKSHIVDHLDNAYECNYIIPIPLTEKILLKCGFVLDILNNGDSPVWLNDNNFYINSKTFQPEDGGFYICRYEIKYLHQLQNLYFVLTQKELEIQL